MTASDTQPVQDLRFFPVPEDRTPGCLSPAQIRHFNHRGYLVGLPVFSDAEAERHRQDFDRLLAQAFTLGMDNYAVTNYERVCACLYDLVTDGRVLDAVQDILGPDILCWGTHCFAKMPGDPKQVSWHQDATYWKLSPSKTVTAWLAIDDVDADNGAMLVVPGSHLLGPLPIRQSEPEENNALWLTVDGVERLPEPVCMAQRAGQMSLHTDLLLHNSPPNPSVRRRCGLAIRYCTTDVRIMDGGGRSVILCRGSDPSGYWSHVERPTGNDITITEVPIGRKVSKPLTDFKTRTSSPS